MHSNRGWGSPREDQPEEPNEEPSWGGREAGLLRTLRTRPRQQRRERGGGARPAAQRRAGSLGPAALPRERWCWGPRACALWAAMPVRFRVRPRGSAGSAGWPGWTEPGRHEPGLRGVGRVGAAAAAPARRGARPQLIAGAAGFAGVGDPCAEELVGGDRQSSVVLTEEVF